MAAISAAAIAKIRSFMCISHGLQEMFDFMKEILALAWSLAYSMEWTADVARSFRSHVLSLGYEMDRLVRRDEHPQDESQTEGSYARLPGAPFACVNLPGIMVVFKPENWEVNRGDPNVLRQHVEWHLLSDWVNSVMPRSRYPLVHLPAFDFGFIHRLDVPSSGLLMMATNFAGHALLRFQLDTYELCREYVVLCVNPMAPELSEIRQRLSVDKLNMKSHVKPSGVPALTRLKTLSHAWPQFDPDVCDTFVGVKIKTGRHHQIRAHLTHWAHPPVCDGKYGLSEVMLKDPNLYADMRWFEHCFGRPAIPFFHESGPAPD